jgi:hypothetical protein
MREAEEQLGLVLKGGQARNERDSPASEAGLRGELQKTGDCCCKSNHSKNELSACSRHQGIAENLHPSLFPSENRIFLIQVTGHEQG